MPPEAIIMGKVPGSNQMAGRGRHAWRPGRSINGGRGARAARAPRANNLGSLRRALRNHFAPATSFWNLGSLRSGSKLGSILSQPGER